MFTWGKEIIHREEFFRHHWNSFEKESVALCSRIVLNPTSDQVTRIEEIKLQGLIRPKNVDEAIPLLWDFWGTADHPRLSHPRQIYPIYEAVSLITQNVYRTNIPALTESWRSVLLNLDGRFFYRIGMGNSKFNCSVAFETLAGKTPSFAISQVDLANPAEIDGPLWHDQLRWSSTSDRRGYNREFFL